MKRKKKTALTRISTPMQPNASEARQVRLLMRLAAEHGPRPIRIENWNRFTREGDK